MLSFGDPYFKSLDFSDIYSFPWHHNSLAINIIHHNRWKSKMSAVTKDAFAFELVTAPFSFSNKWHKHTPVKLKLADQIKWPYKLKQEKQKSLPNEVPELAERSFQNWSSNTCLSCKYRRSRCLGVELSVPFLLLLNLATGNPIRFPVKARQWDEQYLIKPWKHALLKKFSERQKKDRQILFWALTRCDVSASFKMWRAGEEY